MSAPPRRSPEVTGLLQEWGKDGGRDVVDRLFVVLQNDLRRLARIHMAKERPGHTLQVTSLIGEAYLRLVGQREANWRNRSHFLGVAAVCMRRVLVDHARKRRALKRPQTPVDLDEIFVAGVSKIEDILPVHQALEKLAALDADQASLVEMRFFGGLTVDEIAEQAGVSPATVKRELQTARLFLKAQLETDVA